MASMRHLKSATTVAIFSEECRQIVDVAAAPLSVHASPKFFLFWFLGGGFQAPVEVLGVILAAPGRPGPVLGVILAAPGRPGASNRNFQKMWLS